MDNSTRPKATHLLDDLESIRDLLGSNPPPPLLTETLDDYNIPVLSDVVDSNEALPDPIAPPAKAPVPTTAPTPAPTTAHPDTPDALAMLASSAARALTLKQLEPELRNSAQLILQEVIDDFVPKIEDELRRRLEARLNRLLPKL